MTSPQHTGAPPDWDAMTRIAEYGPMTPDRFNAEFRGHDQPAVFRGQALNWPLVQAGRDSSAALSEKLLTAATNAPVKYFEGAPSMNGRFFYSDDLLGFNFERRSASFAEFLERLQATETDVAPRHLYAGAIQLPSNAPDLARDHDHGLIKDGTEQLVSLWIGNRSRTAAHFDLPQNLACVLRGHRRFILLPITQLPNLYVGPLDRTLAGQPISLVDFLEPDFERHPRFLDALPHALVADLEPGDALYIPSLWFHHVETPEPFGAMMNFWWRDAPAYMFTPMITLMHSLLSIHGLPDKERAAWKTVFDHYAFKVNGEPMEHLPEKARGTFGKMTSEKLQRLKYYLGKSLS